MSLWVNLPIRIILHKFPSSGCLSGDRAHEKAGLDSAQLDMSTMRWLTNKTLPVDTRRSHPSRPHRRPLHPPLLRQRAPPPGPRLPPPLRPHLLLVRELLPLCPDLYADRRRGAGPPHALPQPPQRLPRHRPPHPDPPRPAPARPRPLPPALTPPRPRQPRPRRRHARPARRWPRPAAQQNRPPRLHP